MVNAIPVAKTGDHLDMLLSACIASFGLSVEKAWREEALFFLNVNAEAARLVMSVELGDSAEPSAVYEP
jgi:hypothetical protein